MYQFRPGVVCAILLSAIWLTGCASTSQKVSTEELQRSAMQRWNACLARNADARELPAIQVNKLMRHDCEGYKRDVIALFPRHLAGQIDQLLVSSAYRFIDSIDESSDTAEQPSDLVQTLLR